MASASPANGGTSAGVVQPRVGSPLTHFSAGFLGGVTSTLVLHPLDMVKIRRAAGCDPATAGRGVSKSSTSLFSAFGRIFRSEGVKGLYRGVTPNVCGAGSSWGLYFVCYETLKQWCISSRSPGVSKDAASFGAVQQLSVASVAGLFTLVATNPVSVVRTRLCLQPCVTSEAGATHYSGTLDAIRQTYRHEGARGFYRGFVPGICGVVHGAIQFSAYEQLKAAYNVRIHGRSATAPLSGAEYIACAAASKMLAIGVTYPYQVVRACLQDQLSAYAGCADVVRRVVRSHGVAGLYRGLAAHLVHVVPNICVVLVVYESVAGSATRR